MEFLTEYGLFLAKTVTLIVGLLIVIAAIVNAGQRSRKEHHGELQVTLVNRKYDELEEALKSAVLDHDALKEEHKRKKKQEKLEKKQHKKDKGSEERKKRIFVLDFDGDMKASAVSGLREEINAILTMAEQQDEVLVRLQSPGGLVHSYGLAASQLARITNKSIPLVIAVDEVAASGGYMMACIGNKILAAPFAIIGSIGVLAQLPNFNRLLKKHDIDYELFTAGEYKRTVTMFGENTEKGRQKFMEELEDTHELFKQFVSEHRPQVNLAEVATGEVWYGQRAIERNLVDDIQTSDEYLMAQRQDSEIYELKYTEKKSLQEKLGMAASHSVDSALSRFWDRLRNDRLF